MEDEAGFDGVCICTGTNTWASLPCFKGQDTFKGEIMHSEKYRSAEVRAQRPFLNRDGHCFCLVYARNVTKIRDKQITWSLPCCVPTQMS